MPGAQYNPYDLSPLPSGGFVGDGASVGFWRAVRRNIWPSGPQGRASRSEYCYFWLFAVCCNLVSIVLLSALFDLKITDLIVRGVIGVLGVSPMIRRLHDVNRSGWWFLIAFTIVGAIPLLIWLLSRSDPGRNRFDLPGHEQRPQAGVIAIALDRIEQLDRLRRDGAITEDEYQTLKRATL